MTGPIMVLISALAAAVARKRTARREREAADLYEQYFAGVKAFTQAYLLQAPSDEDWLAEIKPRALEAAKISSRAGADEAIATLAVLLAEADPAEAQRWFQLAAAAGNADAMAGLATLVARVDPAEARRRLQRAAAAGNADAMVGLAVLLAEADPAEARHWFQLAAAAGNTHVMDLLGELLEDQGPLQAAGKARPAWMSPETARVVGASEGKEDGRRGRQNAPDTALRWHAEARSLLGNLAYQQGQLDRAEEHYQAAAELFEAIGDRNAVVRLLAAIGRTLIDRGQFAEALSQLSAALNRATADAAATVQFELNCVMAELAQRSSDDPCSQGPS